MKPAINGCRPRGVGETRFEQKEQGEVRDSSNFLPTFRQNIPISRGSLVSSRFQRVHEETEDEEINPPIFCFNLF